MKYCGQIVRKDPDDPIIEYQSEKKLKAMKETLRSWRLSGLGIDEFPATAGARMHLGEQITKLKWHMIEVGTHIRVIDVEK